MQISIIPFIFVKKIMQVTLNIPNQNAWLALQPLIQYLHIDIIESKKGETIAEDKVLSKIELMQKAACDPLFLADIEEITEDFKFADLENIQ